MKKRKYQPHRTVEIKDKALIKWLIKQGAPPPPYSSSSFVLEKGMGERLYLFIKDAETIEMRFYGASHE